METVWRKDRIGIQQLNRPARYTARDVCIVFHHSGAHVADECLNHSNGNAAFDHLRYERVPKIVESQTGESWLIPEAAPGGVPVRLMLIRVIARVRPCAARAQCWRGVRASRSAQERLLQIARMHE